MKATLISPLIARLFEPLKSSALCRYYYDFDEGDNYISIPNYSVQVGDVIRVKYNSTDLNSGYFWRGSASSFLRQWTTGAIYFEGGSAKIDGVVATSLSTPLPEDGQEHEIEFTATTAFVLTAILTRQDSFSNGVLGCFYDFGINGDRFYAIGDNSTVIVDSVSGQNGTLINGDSNNWQNKCS
tara:strand:+ start:5603 stop:6151 length:549 start_codon:yes stop_codon:yes gene_type:complete